METMDEGNKKNEEKPNTKREMRNIFRSRFGRKGIFKASVIFKNNAKVPEKKAMRKVVHCPNPYFESSIPKMYLLKIDKKLERTRQKFFPEPKKLKKRRVQRAFLKSERGKDKIMRSDDAWSVCSNECFSFLGPRSNKRRQNLLRGRKAFWKTSMLSLPLSFSQNATDLFQRQHMLWRSLQHLQRLYEEKNLNIQLISEMFDAEFVKISENPSFQHFNYCIFNRHRRNRKTRLSQWTFLRQESNLLQIPIEKKRQPSAVEAEDLRRKCRAHPRCEGLPQREDCRAMEVDELSADPTVKLAQQLRKKKMAPNSEEDSQISFPNRRGCATEFVDKEPLRPPVYNPEDYATSLKKWGKKGSSGLSIPQYLSQSTGSLERLSEELCFKKKRQSSPSTKSSSSIKSGDEKQSKKERELTPKTEKKDLKNRENFNRGLKSDLQKDFLNPILNLSPRTGEMSLREFSSVTELLTKLKVDLKLSFPSFVQEFVGDPIDGVTLLLELLRCVQLTQTSQQQRCPPQILRRALLDEHSCLVCLRHCLRCSDASRRLASSPAGLFPLAVCIMSNVTQSRIIALELLMKACEPRAGGHKAVSEALSTLRLRFGEPVRFRFLVGMLSSAGAVELLTAAVKFINVFVESAPNLQQKVYIQAELEQAGFDSDILRKSLPSNSESVRVELNKWEKNYFDVEKLHNKVIEVNVLQEKVHLLEKRIKILQEEKEILQSLERCLKERCSELEEEVSIKTNLPAKNSPAKPFRNRETKQIMKATEKGESTPAEDEGISSSEQELSQDEDYVKKAIPYTDSNDLENITKPMKIKREKQAATETGRYVNNVTNDCDLKNIKNVIGKKMKESNVDDGHEIIPLRGEEDEEEEETTIDEVIEELENIVNDAETEALASEDKVKMVRELRSPFATQRKLGSGGRTGHRIRRTFASQEKISFEESEIVPAKLYPQPPKKAKSLIHIYFPGSDSDSHGCNENGFFEGSDSETSDSLLTAAREEKSPNRCRRSLGIPDSFDSCSSVNTRTLFIAHEQEFGESYLNPRSNFQERNIDEEESKRKHLKATVPKAQTVFPGPDFKSKYSLKRTDNVEMESRIAEKTNEKANCFNFRPVGSSFADKASNESPRPRTPKFAPAPVKRSQTFHVTSTDREVFHRRVEMKPKPIMGVRGLDFQRSEQKVKSGNWTYRVLECEKNLEARAEASDRYLNRETQPKEPGKGRPAELREGAPSTERASPSDSFSAVKSDRGKEPIAGLKLQKPAVRARSIEKMDEGLNSLIDIVISCDKSKKAKLKTEWNAEVSKNIGPRTRRSLAESSLFCSQPAKNTSAGEETQIPPKPAQRTSLARNNSSATPEMRVPEEIKMDSLQLEHRRCRTHFGPKAIKSAENLLGPSARSKRCPPDGSSDPIDSRKKSQESSRSPEDESSSVSRTPLKPNTMHTFFGNPKFNVSPSGDRRLNRNYFETNYAAVGSDNRSVTSQSRNSQSSPKTLQEKLKDQAAIPDSVAETSNAYKRAGGKDDRTESKPAFFLGTYQSQPPRILNSKAKISNSSMLQSINSFNNNNGYSNINNNNKNNSFVEKSSASSIPYSRAKENSGDFTSGKVTDSPSGLY